MPSIADPSKQDFDLTDVDEDDFSFFLIEPWFMCISLIVLMLIIVAACIKMIIDKKDAEIYLQTLGPDGKPSPLDKVIKPRLIVIVCTVMIAVILLMNLIVSCVRAFGDDDDDDDHDD